MPELKQCPFCGGIDLESENNVAGDSDYNRAKEATNFWVFCSTCGAMGGDGETEEEAVILWNKRVKEGEG